MKTEALGAWSKRLRGMFENLLRPKACISM